MKRTPFIFLETRLRESIISSNFCLGPEGQGKLGTYFLVLKDPETNMLTNILVLFGSTRLSKVTHIFYSVVKAKGNVYDINVHYMRLSGTTSMSFGFWRGVSDE